MADPTWATKNWPGPIISQVWEMHLLFKYSAMTIPYTTFLYTAIFRWCNCLMHITTFVLAIFGVLSLWISKNLWGWLSKGQSDDCHEKLCTRVEMALTRPGPTQAYLWPTVNKRRPGFDLGTFWPDPMRFFWTQRRRAKNLKNFDF